MTRHAMNLLVVLVALSCPAMAAGVDLNLFAGLDLGSTLSVGDVDYDLTTGYSLGLEVVVNVPVVQVGGGLEYGFPRDVEGFHNLDYDYVFAYGVGRIDLGPFVYGVARLGYAHVSSSELFNGQVDGSAAWSLGAGVKIVRWFKAEALYTQFHGDLHADGVSLRAIVTF
jgi:hypothetical protein